MIVFPMAGASSRFAQAGYLKPKFMLPVGSGYVFDYAVRGMTGAEDNDELVFIHRGEGDIEEFILGRCEAIGLRRPRTFALTAQTRGQAETVEMGLLGLGISAKPLWIFNIDTFRSKRPFLARADRGDGYLEVFHGSGANWSFVLSEPGSNRVQLTTEKLPVSDLCCNGLYHFADAGLFLEALARERRDPVCNLGEYYVAPLYNHLINHGKDVRYDLVSSEDIVFCGVPSEYEAIQDNPDILNRLMRES